MSKIKSATQIIDPLRKDIPMKEKKSQFNRVEPLIDSEDEGKLTKREKSM